MGESDESTESETCTHSEAIIRPKLADKIYKEASKDGNVVISPISVEIVLAMAYEGAAGETAEKLATILEAADQKETAAKYKRIIENLNGLKNATLCVASKMFISPKFALKSSFENVTEEFFMSKIEPIDFTDNKKAPDEINECVKDKTNKTVTTLDCLDGSAGVLLNAISFKNNWETPFLIEDTTPQPFYIAEDEAVDCKMMFITGCFNYCSYHGKLCAKVLELPCKGKEVSMFIILPNNREDFINQESYLAGVELSNLMKDEEMESRQMEIFLPKFRIEATVDMKPLLQNMGLEKMFDQNTKDFSEMSESSQPLHISQFLQKAFIEIDENGTEPGATIIENPKTESYGEFIVDRPFMFVLQANGENENITLLVGQVVNPRC